MTAHPDMAPHLTPDQVTRCAEAVAAADDLDALLDAGSEAFAAMATLARQGDHIAVAHAAGAVGDVCLRLCATRATTAWAAEDKVRFLRIMVGWAWPANRRLVAVLEMARQAESVVWETE